MADSTLTTETSCAYINIDIHTQATNPNITGHTLPLRNPSWLLNKPNANTKTKSKTDVSMSPTRNQKSYIPPSCPASSISSFRPPRIPQHSLMYTLPLRRLRDILAHVVPNLTLVSVDDLPSTRLPRLYKLNLNVDEGDDGNEDSHLLLSVAPSLSIRLLRQEQHLPLAEATLVRFLESTLDLRPHLNQSVATSDAAPPPPPVEVAEAGSPSSANLSTVLKTVLPRLLKHSSNTREIGYPYSIFSFPSADAAVPLSTISIYLSLPEQAYLDRQLGSLVRQLALVKSPSGSFGTLERVCGDPLFASAAEYETVAISGGGSSTWTQAFRGLMEGILRDGEDMSVLLPYETIRAHFARLEEQLGAVTTPRLLVMDAGDQYNILVNQRAAAEVRSGLSVPRGKKAEGAGAERIGTKLAGLRDWSQGIFGDPLLCSCFDDPSEDFMAGWRPEGSEASSLIEDEEGAPARLLLYRCYRATVEIVTGYYRPAADSSRRELDGRRSLTAALAALETVDDVEPGQAGKRGRGSTAGQGLYDASKRQRVGEGSRKP